MIRESTRRRRRSRSISPGRSKRIKSRSRDRRGRDVAPVRDMERVPPEMFDRRRVEKSGRSRVEARRVTRERDVDRRVNSLAQPGQNSLAISGGSMRGRERDRDVHIREAPPMAQDYRGSDMPRNSGRSAGSAHMLPFSSLRSGPPGGDFGASRGQEYGGPPTSYGNDNGKNSGYPLAVMRDQREREREREMRDRERERIQQRERSKLQDREHEKERHILREREERARAREARAAADLRAAELLRRDTARLRDEAVLHARTSGGSVALPLMPLPESSVGLSERDRDRLPRARPRDRERRGRGGLKKGKYMNKDQVDDLFIRVLKMMADDNTHFPCSASLINDRMRRESREDYNVTNSEYQRFSNVLTRFEASSVVGTTKARDSLQVTWTKFSPRNSSAVGGSQRTDERGERAGRAAASSATANGQRMRRIYFCGADEVPTGAEGDAAATTAITDRYMGIIQLLKEHSEVVSSLLPQGEEDEIAKRRRERFATNPKAASSSQEDKQKGGQSAPVATVMNSGDDVAAADSTIASDGKKGKAVAGSGKKEIEGMDDDAGNAGKDDGNDNDGEDETKLDNDQDEEGIKDDDVANVSGSNGLASSGDGSVAASKNEDSGVAARNGTVVPVPSQSGSIVRDADAYKADIARMRSSQGMVAEVSTPSAGVGYKIAFMVLHKSKPCLCLYKAGGESGDGGASMKLSPMIRGDRMLDIRDYKDPAEIPDIISDWFERRFPVRKRDSSRGRDGRTRRSRRDESRERAAASDSKRTLGERSSQGGQDPTEVTSGNGHASENEEGQAGGEDISPASVGSNSEDTRTEDEDQEEHEEVEDATGDHATGGGGSRERGGTGGAGGLDNDDIDDGNGMMDDDQAGEDYGSEDDQNGGDGRDDASVGWMSSDGT